MESSRPVPMYEPSHPPEMGDWQAPQDRAGGKGQTLALLWQERHFLWNVAWKTFALACLVTLLLPNRYDGVTKIVSGESQNGAASILGKLVGGTATGLGSLDPATLMGLKTPGAFYVQILGSRTVADRLIDRFHLRRHYSRIGRWFPSIYNTRIGRYLLEKDYYAARKDLAGFTSIGEDKTSGVITLTCTDYDPQTAANIANAYVEELNALAAELNTSDAHRERMFLEERLKSTKQALDQASLALSRFSSRNAVMDPQDQGRTMMDAAEKVQGQLIASETELQVQQQVYSDDNVKVRATKARIAGLQSQLKHLFGDPGAAQAQAGRKGKQLYPSMRALPLLGYQYRDLYRQTEIQENVYEFLTQQYETAQIQEVKELPAVSVVDLAVPPERKSGPVRSWIVILCLLAGVTLACFWVIGRNSWEQLARDDSRRWVADEIAGHLRAAVKRMRGGAS